MTKTKQELEQEKVRETEKERCIAWVEYARSMGEQDMRQVSNWINTDEWPEEPEY